MTSNVDQWRTLATSVREQLVDTERYLAYLALVSRHYQARDAYAKWIVAAASCAPFLAEFQRFSAEAATWFVASVPLVAIALPILNFVKTLDTARTLHIAHSELIPDLRGLWRKVQSDPWDKSEEYAGSLQKELESIERRLGEIRPGKLGIPDHARLKKAARSQVREPELPAAIRPPQSRLDRGTGGRGVTNFTTSFQ